MVEDVLAGMPSRRAPMGPLGKGNLESLGQSTLAFSDFVGNDDQRATVALASSLVGDQVSISPVAALPANVLIAYARISADGILEVGLHKAAAGASTPGSLVFDVATFR